MQELIRQEQIINDIVTQISNHKIQNASKVKFKVGRLTNITEKVLLDLFIKAVGPNNLQPEMAIEIEWMPARLKCNQCQNLVESGYVCSRCSSEDLKVISGEEFVLENVYY